MLMWFPANSLLQMPSSGAHRLSSVSSHDSGFVSQDANMHSKPPSPMPSDITSQVPVWAVIFSFILLSGGNYFFLNCRQTRHKATIRALAYFFGVGVGGWGSAIELYQLHMMNFYPPGLIKLFRLKQSEQIAVYRTYSAAHQLMQCSFFWINDLTGYFIFNLGNRI